MNISQRQLHRAALAMPVKMNQEVLPFHLQENRENEEEEEEQEQEMREDNKSGRESETEGGRERERELVPVLPPWLPWPPVSPHTQ